MSADAQPGGQTGVADPPHAALVSEVLEPLLAAMLGAGLQIANIAADRYRRTLESLTAAAGRLVDEPGVDDATRFEQWRGLQEVLAEARALLAGTEPAAPPSDAPDVPEVPIPAGIAQRVASIARTHEAVTFHPDDPNAAAIAAAAGIEGITAAPSTAVQFRTISPAGRLRGAPATTGLQG